MPVDMPPSSFIRAGRLGKRALKPNAKSAGKVTKKTLIANTQLISGETLSHSPARSRLSSTSTAAYSDKTATTRKL